MTALSEVLAFKFPGIEGIRTREKSNHPEPFDPFRDMEIIDWPVATTGRPEPTTAELATWRGEFQARPVVKLPPAADVADVSVQELITQMITDGTMTQGKINVIKAAR